MVTKAPPGVSTAVGLLLKIFPTVRDEISKVRGKPTKADSERLITYARRLDERRVFYFPYDVECEVMCISSLDEVRRFTDETLAATGNETARAALGGILDHLRAFLDKWSGARMPRHHWDRHGFRGMRPGDDPDGIEGFFQDLGELRGSMKQMLELLMLVEPKVKAPNLLPDREA